MDKTIFEKHFYKKSCIKTICVFWIIISMPQHVELGFDKIMDDIYMPILYANSNKSFRNLILILVLVFEVLPSFQYQKQNSNPWPR